MESRTSAKRARLSSESSSTDTRGEVKVVLLSEESDKKSVSDADSERSISISPSSSDEVMFKVENQTVATSLGAPGGVPASDQVVQESSVTVVQSEATNKPETAKRARPKLRTAQAVNLKPKINLSQPDPPPAGFMNNFNVSEIIKDFLFIGAGYDPSNRVVTHLPGDRADEALKAERLSWFQSRNVKYALNMAGSPLQKETLGLTYPLGDVIKKLAIDVNDLAEWQTNMAEAFDEGAKFIERAFEEFCAKRTQNEPAPTIFVHCVAGVNRSPFVVVWWLCKYHNVSPQNAWELVRRRRDAGVRWINQTLGGPVITDTNVALPEAENKPCPKIKWFEELQRRFSNSAS